MIIIKSQNERVIISCNRVHRSKKSIVAVGLGSSNKEIVLMADYETEERANEVMGMVEKHIEWLVLIQNNREAAVAYGSDSKFIFEMPKE